MKPSGSSELQRQEHQVVLGRLRILGDLIESARAALGLVGGEAMPPIRRRQSHHLPRSPGVRPRDGPTGGTGHQRGALFGDGKRHARSPRIMTATSFKRPRGRPMPVQAPISAGREAGLTLGSTRGDQARGHPTRRALLARPRANDSEHQAPGPSK